MPKLEVTKLSGHFKTFVAVETIIMVISLYIFTLDPDFDINWDEWIYSLGKTASRMTTALLR